jgi:hypothetical protein
MAETLEALNISPKLLQSKTKDIVSKSRFDSSKSGRYQKIVIYDLFMPRVSNAEGRAYVVPGAA